MWSKIAEKINQSKTLLMGSEREWFLRSNKKRVVLVYSCVFLYVCMRQKGERKQAELVISAKRG